MTCSTFVEYNIISGWASGSKHTAPNPQPGSRSSYIACLSYTSLGWLDIPASSWPTYTTISTKSQSATNSVAPAVHNFTINVYILSMYYARFSGFNPPTLSFGKLPTCTLSSGSWWQIDVYDLIRLDSFWNMLVQLTSRTLQSSWKNLMKRIVTISVPSANSK